MMKLMRSSKAIITSTLIALISTGCSYTPREVEASIPLVSNNTQLNGQEIPTQYWASLDDAQLINLPHPNYQIILEPNYSSALGTTCRKANFVDSNVAKTVTACKDGNRWVLINDIIAKESLVQF